MDIFNPLPLPSKTKIYSVSALNRETKNLLFSHFLSIQVKGEISNLSTPSSGHIYFSLKDKTAQIRCAMFKPQLRSLKFSPKNGQQIIVHAQVSLYEARGDYQLIAENIQQAGVGDLQYAFEQLKNTLQQQGLFDPALKKPIPQIPQHIGIITSPSGAAIHDILSVLNRRFPSIPVLIYPTAVQGNSAQFEISQAIRTANQQHKVDVLLLARGGGSIEDLWAFNEESVANAMASSQIPIISGIGHETDFTIADFVADLRTATPSAAAEHCVPNQHSWLRQFQVIEQQLCRLISNKLSQQQQITTNLTKRLQQQHPEQQFQRHAQTLDNLDARLISVIQSKIADKRTQLADKKHRLHHLSPINRMTLYQQQQHDLTRRLTQAIKRKLDSSQQNHLTLNHALHTISPLATLDRGYAIVSNDKSTAIINNSQQLTVGDTVKTRLAHGCIISQIKEINHE